MAVNEGVMHICSVRSDYDLQTKASCTRHCLGINDQLGELIV